MVDVKHVLRIVSGGKISVSVALDFSVLEDNAEHVTQDLPTTAPTAFAVWVTSATEISVHHVTVVVVNVVDLKLINVLLVLMSHLCFRMDSVLRTPHVILGSSLIMDNVPSAWIIALSVKPSLSARPVLLGTKPIHKNSQDKGLLVVRKFVVMASSMNINVMMATLKMEMDVLAPVRKNKDGSAVEDLPMPPVSARSSSLILFSFLQRGLSILVALLS